MKTFELANFIIDYFQQKKEKIRNMKLQKLMFFCCGWNYAINDTWLIENNDFYAWPYGPVCPELYHEVSQYQNNPIPKKNRKQKIV